MMFEPLVSKKTIHVPNENVINVSYLHKQLKQKYPKVSKNASILLSILLDKELKMFLTTKKRTKLKH